MKCRMQQNAQTDRDVVINIGIFQFPYMKVSRKYWGSWIRWGCCMKRLRIRITKIIIIIIT